MPHRFVRVLLVIVETCIAIGAIAGGIALLTGSFAQGIPVEWLQGTPFRDYTVPGLVLAIVIGGGMLLAAGTTLIRREWAILVSMSMGLAMMGFETVEAVSVDANAWNASGFSLMVELQILMFTLGGVVFSLATFLWMVEYQRQHAQVSRASHVN